MKLLILLAKIWRAQRRYAKADAVFQQAYRQEVGQPKYSDGLVALGNARLDAFTILDGLRSKLTTPRNGGK